MPEDLIIEVGIMAPSLITQLKGYPLSDNEKEHFDKDARAITRLNVRNVLSDAEARKARERLTKSISQAIKEGEKHGKRRS